MKALASLNIGAAECSSANVALGPDGMNWEQGIVSACTGGR
jgi:hypothetical protein